MRNEKNSSRSRRRAPSETSIRYLADSTIPSRKKEARSKKTARSQSSNRCFASNFEALVCIVRSKGIKRSLLKKLYCFLVQFSLNIKCVTELSVDLDSFHLHFGYKLRFGDVLILSEVLFEKLEERFETIFSILFNESANKDLSCHKFTSCDVEVANLLLRCCLLLLSLLASQQNVMLEKVRILLKIFKRLCSPCLFEGTRKCTMVLEKSIIRQCVLGNDDFTTSSTEHLTASVQFLNPNNPLLVLTSTLLEVFVDELSVHEHLRGCFKMVDSIASTSDMLFSPQSVPEDTGVVMEGICNHFILSFSDYQTFENFLGRLFNVHAQENKYSSSGPALSMNAAVSLLSNPVMASAPKFMQAHMIFLVSETAEAVMNIKSLKPDRKLINCFLVMFERSVILYKTHMSYLQGHSSSTSASESALSHSSHEPMHPSFDLFVSPNTKQKLDCLISKLNQSSTQNIHDRFFRMKSDLASSALWTMEFHDSFVMSFRDEIFAILSHFVQNASACFHETTTHSIKATAIQDVYVLASLLKLMSSSLLQVVYCLRHCDGLSCPKTLKNFSSCKEYDFILDVITCFKYFPVNLPFQQFLSAVMSSHSARHKESKMMLLHFSGLMSLRFFHGNDCLVKGCLLTILSLLNLFIFEEGELDALSSMIGSKTDLFPSVYPVFSSKETAVDKRSGIEVTTRFQKIGSIQLSEHVNISQELKYMSSQINIANKLGGMEEKTMGLRPNSGESFLNCVLGKREKASDWDDLVDFVECKEGKDYSVWLKKRRRYRKWRSEKIDVIKKERKKRSGKALPGRQPYQVITGYHGTHNL